MAYEGEVPVPPVTISHPCWIRYTLLGNSGLKYQDATRGINCIAHLQWVSIQFEVRWGHDQCLRGKT